ncbi:EcsC family protein [Gordonia paraffinivorans]|uniref:EcsC family protein n=1 Tax=Gordonia paraffinivorans TaxID=175628 RepID=UPI001446B53E|nr:EcsC family protein [Gordonia paraffinivorans]
MTDGQANMATMSPYERKAWQTLLTDTGGTTTGRPPSNRLASAKSKAKQKARRAKAAVERIPGGTKVLNGVDASFHSALEGIHTLTVERGLYSVNASSVIKAYGKDGIVIRSIDDIRSLDLRYCDRSLPRKREGYLFAGTAEGALSSIAVTGAVVSSTVSGGTTAAVALGAVAADVATVLVGMGRIVALVAAHYGYDVRDPDEQVFAAGVITYSSAGSAAEKAASLASLSRLTQTMMRRATWKQLSSDKLVKVIEAVFTSLGLRLTHRKIAQVVPVAGAVVNGAMNAHFVNQTFKRAQQAYRLRFLTEKYGMNPADWSPLQAPDTAPPVSPLPHVDEMVDAEIAELDGRVEDEV